MRKKEATPDADSSTRASPDLKLVNDVGVFDFNGFARLPPEIVILDVEPFAVRALKSASAMATLNRTRKAAFIITLRPSTPKQNTPKSGLENAPKRTSDPR
jgi:hypothetical protein